MTFQLKVRDEHRVEYLLSTAQRLLATATINDADYRFFSKVLSEGIYARENSADQIEFCLKNWAEVWIEQLIERYR